MPPKRAVKITKHLGSVPVEAVCTACGKRFLAPLHTLPRVKEATGHLQEQFDRHKCEREDVRGL